jgi:SAM-dependent methyltransferase
MYEAEIITNTPVSTSMIDGLESTAQYILKHSSITAPTVLDVGAGSGALSLILSRRAKHVHMIEPSTAFDQTLFDISNITYHQNPFPVPSISNELFDIIVVRQVLEHMLDPISFLTKISNSLTPRGIIYLEVPSLDYISENGAIFDFHYPHIHYFHKALLNMIFKSLDLCLIDFIELKDGHDYGFILKRILPKRDTKLIHVQYLEECDTPKQLTKLIDLVDFNYSVIRNRLNVICERPYALYGANAYAQSFVGIYPDHLEQLKMVFDDTESYNGKMAYSHGKFIPISTISLKSQADVDVIIISAYLHDEHIYHKLQSLGFTGEVYTLRSKSRTAVGYSSLLC